VVIENPASVSCRSICRQARRGSFGSIHGPLNHILLGDLIWMARFKGNGSGTPGLGTIMFDEFAPLHHA
jgi:uncharacterized damage-inducible protein DinB